METLIKSFFHLSRLIKTASQLKWQEKKRECDIKGSRHAHCRKDILKYTCSGKTQNDSVSQRTQSPSALCRCRGPPLLADTFIAIYKINKINESKRGLEGIHRPKYCQEG